VISMVDIVYGYCVFGIMIAITTYGEIVPVDREVKTLIRILDPWVHIKAKFYS
jgi:hypothetical protein